jgi:hypothetical protein
METGLVKRCNDAKGFCFITSDLGFDELFAHFQEMRAGSVSNRSRKISACPSRPRRARRRSRQRTSRRWLACGAGQALPQQTLAKIAEVFIFFGTRLNEGKCIQFLHGENRTLLGTAIRKLIH